MAPSRQHNGTTGREKNLTVSCDDTKQEFLSKTSRRSRVHVPTAGLNAETKSCRH